MSYTNLPPGRDRLLAYSNFISNRRQIPTVRQQIQQLRRQRMSIRQVYFSVDFYYGNGNSTQSYDVLSSLKDVKVGVEFKNLFEKSRIEKNKEQSFFVICQDNIHIDDFVRIINCKHGYHIDCIDKWFVENKKCPTCKFEI